MRESRKRPLWRKPTTEQTVQQASWFRWIVLATLLLAIFAVYFVQWHVALVTSLSISLNAYLLLTHVSLSQSNKKSEKKKQNATGVGSRFTKMRVEYDEEEVKNAKYQVICMDAIQWLKQQDKLNGYVVTSMPDYSEINMPVEEWKVWFTNAAELILQKLPEGSCAIFYQTDVKVLESNVVDDIDGQKRSECSEWVDKSFLCQLGASRVPNVKLLFHKIMLLSDVGSIKLGRPGYTHMLCFGKDRMDKLEKRPLPDVLDRGDMIYAKAMGVNACILAAMFCKSNGAKLIIDPFCGKGSSLLAANFMGMDALGVDISQGRCRNAQNMKTHGLEGFISGIKERSFVSVHSKRIAKSVAKRDEQIESEEN